ncbi:hypothetical protein CURE108131_08650 [Cupriavidus respiraculi]|uniref:Uncharacterized protein n=2 Tax=Cupriavidus respiraculi TaxID=195930 RepID=A0ABN7Y4Z9_9BURK|nr:hypothetical protein LMG21510_01079 [Cupriavidus respiraculi]
MGICGNKPRGNPVYRFHSVTMLCRINVMPPRRCKHRLARWHDSEAFFTHFMRALALILVALCLSLLSFGAAANAHAERTGASKGGMALAGTDDLAHLRELLAEAAGREALGLEADEDAGHVVAPGDDGLQPEDLVQERHHPGYCNIWSADLLDPPDVLDELEESMALFALPVVRVTLPSGDISPVSPGAAPPALVALFKPPISLA